MKNYKCSYCTLTMQTGEKWLLPIKLCPLHKSSDWVLLTEQLLPPRSIQSSENIYCCRLMHRCDGCFVQGLISAKFPFLNSSVPWPRQHVWCGKIVNFTVICWELKLKTDLWAASQAEELLCITKSFRKFCQRSARDRSWNVLPWETLGQPWMGNILSVFSPCSQSSFVCDCLH